MGMDQINAKLLKDYASSIVSMLIKIFNTSLFSQTFPDIWKKGNIVPLYKSRPTSPNNYSRITILPILSKILEHIVHQQVYEYLQQNNLITSDQLGFCPKLSMNIALTNYDTLLYHFAKTVTDLESQLNTDLQSVSHCLNNNLF